jgi:hypothetical protein
MENEHKRRLIARLEALKQAVEENGVSEEVARAVYEELRRVDSLFPEGVKTHSIMELEGLGAEYWRSIDVEKYLEEERASWERPEGWPNRH